MPRPLEDSMSTMMKTTGRVFGIVGMLGLFACTQACNSQENANVSVKSGVNTTGCTDEQLKASGGICTSGMTTGGKTGERQTTGPTPPAGYTVRWSLCKYFHTNETNDLRNNSRIVQIDETNDGKQYPLSPNYMKVPLIDPDDDRATVVWGNVDDVINETVQFKGKPLVTKTVYPGMKGADPYTLNRIGKVERALKIGQAVLWKGRIWTVTSANLGQAVAFNHPKYGPGLAYEDHCYRSAKAQGADTAGRVASGTELSALCVVEDNLAEYNAISYYGWKQIYNWATAKVPMANNPEGHYHPDFCANVEKDASSSGVFWYTQFSAAMNDMNGTERDDTGIYFAGEDFCHMMVSGGYEVPAAKRPATRSTPYPGSITKSSYLLWRPVNMSLTIANDTEAVVYDAYEAEPVAPAEY